MILLDTHIWLWFIFGDEKLSKTMKDRIEESPNEVLISSISVWEALILGEKGRVTMKPSPNEFIRQALKIFPFEVVPITGEISLLSRGLEFKQQDPADRFIAATSLVNDAPLVTSDKALKKLSWLKTI